MRAAGQLTVVIGVLSCGLAGWAVGGGLGSAGGLTIGLALLVVPWRGQPLWAWARHYLRRNRPVSLMAPLTVVNDRSGGGMRYQDGVAATAIQLLGKTHRPTFFIGSTTTYTENAVDLAGLVPMMHQSLGLRIESLSVVSAGSRRRSSGDYPRVYDTLIGPSPYAGQRDTWLIIRIRALDNGDALRWRTTVGTAALAATQRIAAELRRRGLGTKVATATEITELEGILGRDALKPANRRWGALRGETGWMTTYGYRRGDLSTELLASAWSLRVDGVIQTITLFPDRTCCASLMVRTAQPLTVPPSTALEALPGEQIPAFAQNLCAPRPHLRGLGRGTLPAALTVPLGPSGVLLGKVASGDRMLLPLRGPGSSSRVRVCADDAIVKRVIVRAAATGERLTVHTADPDRWESVRMPHVIVTDQARPAPGTTVSVTDGTVVPAPRPKTVIHACDRGAGKHDPADVVITQTGPSTLRVGAGGADYDVDMEFFRAENRYLSSLVMAD